MFRDEADLAAKLVHKNVCHVQSFGQFGGTWFIAMEYLHGVPLSRMMTRLSKAQKMLDYRVVAGIITQACEGLHAAHEARDAQGNLLGVVHRDVSPPNIMVTGDGLVKLLDFGIAKARGANSRTRTGTVKGKNAYMSPEQILGKPLDRRSDVFALAVVMYEMLAIRRLFHRDSDFLTFKAITEEPIPEIRDRRADVPAGMRAALIQAMARDPNGRFDTAQAFGNAIKNSVATLGGPASPQELARLLFNDFGDEMASRDEILKAADDPAAAPVSITVPPPRPPPVPVVAPQPATSGEMAHNSGRSKAPTGPLTPVPSMIFNPPGTGKLQLVDLDQVLDLSADVGADAWMADGGTNLLAAHRWKSLRNAFIAIAVFAALIGVIVFVVQFLNSRAAQKTPNYAAAPLDAAIRQPIHDIPIDADTKEHDDIIALSKFGFYSLTSNSKTTVFVDDKNIGETPLTRLPLKPGPHVVKAVGPKNKSKIIKITIIGGQDTDSGSVDW
jgi:hypothetical protein